MGTVIKVENISKQYRLGDVGTGTLSHDLKRWWYKVRGKEDPYLLVGETNDRSTKGESDYVWALKDINFEVRVGDVLGIIGRNGAGKSTLLKILSKTTTPTTGSIKVRGRIASLLEVGTGFHPALTGRENIFLNGAILGMTKREIQLKFDEIVDFSGVERYIDTPVKRYSSGMYVRLAFAVAAHLEPEILIVDEVLAVGDVDFQKKCLGKMKDVSVNEGRTVLFVSHNMGAVQNLCSNAILLDSGKIVKIGESKNVLNHYLNFDNGKSLTKVIRSNKFLPISIINTSLLNSYGSTINKVRYEEDFFISIAVLIEELGNNYSVSFDLISVEHGIIFTSSILDDNFSSSPIFKKKGSYKLRIKIPKFFLRQGEYYLSFITSIPKIEIISEYPSQLYFVVEDYTSLTAITGEGKSGYIMPKLKWDYESEQ